MKHGTAICCRRRVATLALASVAMPWVITHSAQSQYKYYVGGALGYWSSTSSWSTIPPPGNAPQAVPVNGDYVYVTNAAGSAQTLTYNVSGYGISLGSLFIDATGGSTSTENETLLLSTGGETLAVIPGGISVGVNGVGTINQSAGSITSFSTVQLGSDSGSDGNYLLSGSGSLAVSQGESVGVAGTGFFNQTGGSNTVEAGSSLFVGTGSTYLMNGSSSQLTVSGRETVSGTSASYATFAQYNGTHSVTGALTVTNGTFSQSAGSLSAANLTIGLSSAPNGSTFGGSFTQSGGSNTVGTPGSNGNLILGNGSNAQGVTASDAGCTYTLSNSTSQLAVNGNEFIGYNTIANASFTAGRDAFVQNAGTHQVTGYLELGFNGETSNQSVSGSFTLNGGGLSAGSEFVGDSGAGVFIQQNASTNTVATQLVIAGQGGSVGTYQLNGTGSLNVSGGAVYVGYGGNGTFNQSGATFTAGSVTVGSQFNSGVALFNQASGSTTVTGSLSLVMGSYTLSGNGVLTAASETVGAASTASFNQTGGTHTVTGLLDLGTGSSGVGTYILSGSSSQLSAGSITVGDQNSGVFNQTGGSVTVSGALTIGNLYASQNPFGQTSFGSYAMNGSGSSVTAATETIGTGGSSGFGGYGSFTQYNGTNTVTTGFSIGSLSITIGSGFGVDAYDVKAGTLNLPTGSTAACNYGEFIVDGGTVNGYLNNPLYGASFVNLNGGNFAGTLNNNSIVTINPGASFTGTLINASTVTQSGGNITGVVENQSAYYLNGGTFNASNAAGISVNAAGAYFYQAGGSIGGTFLNSGVFIYTSGTISGRVINQGSFNISSAGVVFGNGLENDGSLNLPNPGTGVVATFNGQGLDNFASIYVPAAEALGGTIINDYGGTLSGQGTIAGTLSNLGTLSPGDGFTVTGTLTNGGVIGPSYSASLLKATGGLTNTGQIQMTGGQITGGTIINSGGGVIEFSPAGSNTTVSGFNQAVNNSGGVIEIGMGTQVTFASFAAGNNNGGDIQIANSSTMTISTAFPNSGTIELEGPAAALNGGAITNTGSITGQGRISNAVLNSGVVESRPAGLLQISAAGSTNLAGAQIIADAGTTVQYSQGLSTNAGTITLAGGTFDNNSRAMINTVVINGSGSFRTGGAGLNNSAGAIIDVTAGTSFFGPVSNSGYITSYGSTNTFYSNVTDASGGTIKVTNGTVYFLGNPGATVSGSYNSDPSDNYFNTLATTSTGTVIGGSGDRFLLINGTTFTNAGTFHNTGTLSAASVANSGSFLQTGTLAETGNFTNSGTASIGGNQNWSQGTLFTNTAGTATFESDAGSLGTENLSVSVTGGSVLFTSTQHILALNISNGAIAIVTGNGNGNRSLICTAALSDAGTLDLTGNDLDVQSGGTAALATVNTLIAHGYANGTWTGTGITSSAAANDSSHLTAVGVLLNTAGGTMPLYTSLDGATVAENDVLVKGTYYGDADLDGKVDGSDYSRIDNGYLSRLTGWFNGDFNYDSFINGSDYTLIDNAFNTQGAQLDAAFADASEARTAQIAGIASVPEPGAFLFLAAGIHMLLGRTRRMLGSSRDREISLALRKT